MLTIAGGILLAALALGFIYGAYHFGAATDEVSEMENVGRGLRFAIGASIIVLVLGVLLSRLGHV